MQFLIRCCRTSLAHIGKNARFFRQVAIIFHLMLSRLGSVPKGHTRHGGGNAPKQYPPYLMVDHQPSMVQLRVVHSNGSPTVDQRLEMPFTEPRDVTNDNVQASGCSMCSAASSCRSTPSRNQKHSMVTARSKPDKKVQVSAVKSQVHSLFTMKVHLLTIQMFRKCPLGVGRPNGPLVSLCILESQ